MQRSWIGMVGAAVIAAPAIAAPNPSNESVAPARQRTAVQRHVDLNSASRNELMTLPGIGAAEASRIVANRPYLTKTDLVTKNVLPIGPFLSVKNLVVAMPTKPPKGRP